MTPSELQALTRSEALFLIGHELVCRLLEIERGCLTIDVDTGEGSLFTVTEEGKFLADLIRDIEAMRGVAR